MTTIKIQDHHPLNTARMSLCGPSPPLISSSWQALFSVPLALPFPKCHGSKFTQYGPFWVSLGALSALFSLSALHLGFTPAAFPEMCSFLWLSTISLYGRAMFHLTTPGWQMFGLLPVVGNYEESCWKYFCTGFGVSIGFREIPSSGNAESWVECISGL